jgi:hypothetical protein
VKHVSLIVYILATEKTLIPDIATSQDSIPLREALKKRGVRFGTDLILKAREKGHVNTEIFLE